MKDSLLIFGLHAVTALLNKNPDRVLRLAISEERHDQKITGVIQQAKQLHIKIDYLSKNALEKLASTENHQGILAYCSPPKVYSEYDLEQILDNLVMPPFLLILDGVQDPHNLGACFRSAEAAGVHAIIAPKDKSVGLTPTVCKVASGAVDMVPFVQVTNLARTLTSLKERNIWLYGAAAEAKNTLYQAPLSGALAIIMGSEGQGLRRLTKELCDDLLKIPLIGTVSSLNVSVATGIFLFEAIRQQSISK